MILEFTSKQYAQMRSAHRAASVSTISGVAVDLRLSEVVDVPNFVVAVFLPLYISVA